MSSGRIQIKRQSRDVAHEQHQTRLASAEVEQNLPPWLGWFFRGTGDFNRDGYPDFLIYHPESGQVIVWSMVDNQLVAVDWVRDAQAAASSGWEIRGTGDFDRDGYTDILWWHPTGGDVSVWFIDGFRCEENSPS